MGACFLMFCTSALLIGKYRLGFDIGEIRTLCTVTLVFGGEAVLYNVRERQHLWRSWPSRWVIIASGADVVIISAFAIRGIVMKALPISDVAAVFIAAVVFALLLDLIKVPLYRRLHIARQNFRLYPCARDILFGAVQTKYEIEDRKISGPLGPCTSIDAAILSRFRPEQRHHNEVFIEVGRPLSLLFSF